MTSLFTHGIHASSRTTHLFLTFQDEPLPLEFSGMRLVFPYYGDEPLRKKISHIPYYGLDIDMIVWYNTDNEGRMTQ
jgi:hypothetical protein